MTYEITKGKKVFFGEMQIVGNEKTRDNVIRREFEVFDSELYSGTRLSRTKRNITRLGFFEDVQVIKERDIDEDVINLKIKVKERSTGQLQAALGFQPGGETRQAWFTQGRYNEQNQSGKAWNTNITFKWTNVNDYRLDLGFLDPRVDDSDWSLGFNLDYESRLTRYAANINIPEKRRGFSASIGRTLFELVRTTLRFRHRKTEYDDLYVFEGFQARGVTNTLSLAITRQNVDNFLDPTEGSTFNFSQNINGGFVGGDFHFLETILNATYFHPLMLSDDFRTFFKFNLSSAFLKKLGSYVIPTNERYRLGGPNNLRGFDFWSLGPKDKRGRTPLGSFYEYNIGRETSNFSYN